MKDKALIIIIVIAFLLIIVSILWVLCEAVMIPFGYPFNWYSVLSLPLTFGFLIFSGWLKIRFETFNPNKYDGTEE